MANFFGPISEKQIVTHAKVLESYLKQLTTEEFLALANKHGQSMIKYMKNNPMLPCNDNGKE